MVASIDDEYGMLPYLAARFMENALQPGLWIVFAFCVISAMAVFSYLYSPRSANAEASLPIRRTTQLFVHYLAGLFWLLAANVLIFLSVSYTHLAQSASGQFLLTSAYHSRSQINQVISYYI